MNSKTIVGCTDICLVPHGSDLKDIRLNCRQCTIESVFVNDVLILLSVILPF